MQAVSFVSVSPPGDSHSKHVQLLWEAATRHFVPAVTENHPGDEIVPHIAITLSSEELVMELMKLMLE